MKLPKTGLLIGIGIGLLTTVGVVMAASGGTTQPVPVVESVIENQVATTTAVSESSKKLTEATSTRVATEPKIEAQPVETRIENKPSVTSSNDYYTNVDGNQIHTPVQSDAAPAGATAKCRDGSYSFSQHHRGTCSHHGGVLSWI